MRWIYLAVIVLFAAATIIFALQNFEIVTVAFLGSAARIPLALLVAVVYLLGRSDGRQPVCIAAPIIRRVKTQRDGHFLN